MQVELLSNHNIHYYFKKSTSDRCLTESKADVELRQSPRIVATVRNFIPNAAVNKSNLNQLLQILQCIQIHVVLVHGANLHCPMCSETMMSCGVMHNSYILCGPIKFDLYQS